MFRVWTDSPRTKTGGRVRVRDMAIRAGGIDVSESRAGDRNRERETAKVEKEAEARAACRQRIIDVVTEMGEVSAVRLRSEVDGSRTTKTEEIDALVHDGVLVIGHHGSQTLYRLAAPHKALSNAADRSAPEVGASIERDG
jgi:hypothetical protein